MKQTILRWLKQYGEDVRCPITEEERAEWRQLGW